MSEKKSYTKFISPLGTAIFPHLIRPDTKFDSDGVYRVKLAVDAEAAQDFIEVLEAERDAFAAEFKAEEPAKFKKANIADVFEPELDEEGEETGRVIITAKQKARVKGKDGETYEKVVRLFDSQNNLIKPKSMWTGTKLKLAGVLIPYYMASSKTIGVSLRLGAAQIFDLVEGDGASGESYGFGAEDGGYVGETFENTDANDAGGGDTDGEGDDF